MEENINNLIKKFKIISKKGWIESKFPGNSSVGRTFENELGLNENSFEIPDYYGIEIKTKLSNKNRFTTLFNCKSESDTYKDSERLRDLYGYADKQFPLFKVLNNSVFFNKKTDIGIKYKFRLDINEKKQKIILNVYNKYNKIIDRKSYWDFSTLEEKLNRKLKYLAYVKAKKKFANNKHYFKYEEIKIYKLKNFNNFIKLIENGKIRITFKIGIYKNKEKFGMTYDHGTGFDIEEKNLLSLYDLVTEYHIK